MMRLSLLLLVGIISLIWLIPAQVQEDHQSHITSLVWNSTGTIFAVTYSTPTDERRFYPPPDRYSIKLFNADLTPYQDLTGHLCSVNSAEFNPAGTELISVDYTGTDIIWDINSGEIIDRVVGMLPREKVIWRPNSMDFAVMVYDAVGIAETLRESSGAFLLASNVGFTGKFTDIDWSPDGQFIVAGNDDGTVRIWDVSESNKITSVFQGHNNPIASVAWNLVANNKVVASGDRGGVIKIWNAETGQTITTLIAHSGAVNSLEWSADGRVLASGGDDGIVRVWRIENSISTVVAAIDYGAPVYAVAFNPAVSKIAYGGAGINGQNGEAAISNLNLDSLPVAPLARAGVDLTYGSIDSSIGLVILDGATSADTDGMITNYLWQAGDTVLANGANAQVELMLEVGTHTFTLTVTDNDGLMSSDEVIVMVIEATVTPTPTATYTVTDTPTVTNTPTITRTPTYTITPSFTPTRTYPPTFTPTSTPVPP